MIMQRQSAPMWAAAGSRRGPKTSKYAQVYAEWMRLQPGEWARVSCEPGDPPLHTLLYALRNWARTHPVGAVHYVGGEIWITGSDPAASREGDA